MSIFNRNADDTRVVSLVFDNSGFESNAKQSLSTLSKLKNALNESTKVKIFDDINEGVRSVTIQPIVDGVNEVTAKFSTLTSMTDQWKRRMADTVYDAVTGVIKSSTVGQLTAGWAKYEEITQSVQTIMAATARDWANQEQQMQYVNEQLEKLNWYSDETSASLTDMTDNIGKFINNGANIEDATSALMGVSNWAYISGANIQQASRAMYNLSQAMGVGAVKLQDWMSIENAQMATMEFKETVLETGVEMGILEKASDGVWRSIEKGTEITLSGFREDLKDGWFTSELLVESLRKYSSYTEALHKSLKRLGDDVTATDLIGWVDDFRDGVLGADGIAEIAEDLGLSADYLRGEIEALASSEYDLSRKATKAAQEAKTLSEALGSVKDAASTAWMSIYETLFGDYLIQKEFWTSISNMLYDAFVEPVNGIGKAIEGAFEKEVIIGQKEWNLLKKEGLVSDDSIDEIVEFARKFGYITDAMEVDAENFEESLSKGWFTSGLIRKMWEYEDGALKASEATRTGIKDVRDFRKLAEKLANDPVQGQGNELFGWKTDFEKNGFNEEAYEVYVQTIIDEYEKLKEEVGEAAYVTDEIMDKADAALLKYLGLTDGSVEATAEYIKKLEEEGDTYDHLCAEVEKLGRYVTKTNDEGETEKVLAKMDGAYYWSESLRDIVFSLGELIRVVSEEFEKVFGGSGQQSVQQFTLSVYDTVERFKHFVMTSQTLKDVLDIIFSIGKIALTSFQRKLGLISTIINAIMGGISGEQNGVTGFIHSVAEALTKFAEFFSSTNLFTEAFGLLGDVLGDATAGIREWFSELGKGEGETEGIVSKIWSGLIEGFSRLGDLFHGLRNQYKKFKTMVDGLDDKNFLSIFTTFKKTILDYIAGFPGFDRIKSAFVDLKDVVKGALKNIGIDVDGILEFFGRAGDTMSPWLSWLLEKGETLAGIIATVFGAIGSGTFTKINFTNFKTAFSDFFGSLGPWFSDFKSKWDDFKKLVSDSGGFKLSNIGNIFKSFYETIIQHFADFNGFDSFKAAFQGLFDGVNEKLQEIGIDIPGFFESIANKFNEFKSNIEQNPVVQAIQTIFKEIGDKVSGYVTDMGGLEGFTDKVKEKWEQLKSIASTIKTVFTVVKDAVGEAIDFITNKFDLFKIPEALATFLGIKTGASNGGGGHFEEAETDSVVATMVKATENVKTFVQEVSGMSKSEFTIPKWLGQLKDEVLALVYAFMAFKTVSNITSIISGMNSLKEAVASGVQKTNALKIAAAIGILAGVIYAMSTLTQDQIMQGSIAAAGCAAVIAILAVVFSKINQTNSVYAVATSMLEIAAAIGMLAGLIWLLGVLPGTNLKQSALFIGGAIVTLLGTLVAMTFIGPVAVPAGLSMLGVAAAIGMLSVIAWLMGHANLMAIGKGAAVIVGGLAILMGAFKLMNHWKIDASDSMQGMKDVAVALLALAAAVIVLQFVNPSRFLNILTGVGTIIGAFFLICATMRLFKDGMKDTGNTFKNLAILFGVMAGAIIVLGVINFNIIKQGELALLGIAGILSVVIIVMGLASLMGADLPKMKGTIGMLTLLIASVGIMLAVLAGVLGEGDPQKYVTIAEAMVIVMAAVAGIMLALTVPAKYADKMSKALGAVAVGILAAVGAAAALWLASSVIKDPEKLVTVAQAIGLVMLAIAALMVAAAAPAKLVKEGDTGKVWQGLAVGVVAAVGAAVALMIASKAVEDPEKLIKIAEAMAIVMGMIALVMAAVAVPAKMINGDNLVNALGSLVLAVLAMAAVAGALTMVAGAVEDTSKLIEAAQAIAVGLGAVVVVAALMGVIGALSGAVAAGAVVIGLIVVAMIGIGLIVREMDPQDIQTEIDAIKKFGEFMGAVGDAIGRLIGGFVGGIGAGIIQSMDNISATLQHLSYMLEAVDYDAINAGCESLGKLSGQMVSMAWDQLWAGIFGGLDGSVGMLWTFKHNTDELATALINFSNRMIEVGTLYIPVNEITALSNAIKSLPFKRTDFVGLFVGDDHAEPEDVKEFGTMGELLGEAFEKFIEKLPQNYDVERVSVAATFLDAIGKLIYGAAAMKSQGLTVTQVLTDQIGTAVTGICTALSEASNAEYNTKNLEELSGSVETIQTLLDNFGTIKLPTGNITSDMYVGHVFGNIATIADTLDSFKDKDLTNGETLISAIEKLEEITLEGDIMASDKVTTFKNNAESLSAAFLDVAEQSIAARKDLAGEPAGVDTSGTQLMDMISNAKSGLDDLTGSINGLADAGGLNEVVQTLLGGKDGIDITSMMDGILPEGFDFKTEFFKKMGFEDGNFDLFNGQTLEGMLGDFVGKDANGNFDMASLLSEYGLDDLSGTFSGLSTDMSGLTDALSGDGENSLPSLLGNLGGVLGGTDGTNAQFAELQSIIGTIGDEANGISASGLIDQVQTLKDELNFGDTGTGELKCQLVLDTTEYDAAIERLRTGVTTDGYLAAPEVSSLIQATIDFSPIENAIDGLKTDNQTNFSRVQDLVSGLSSDIISLADAIESIQMILDTGTLVGEMTPMINRELGYLVDIG